MLYVSKVPALLQHAFLVGQATVVASLPDCTSSDGSGGNYNNNNDGVGRRLEDNDAAAAAAATTTGRRAAALARMTTAYTIGATIGPALGGYLASTASDLYVGARLAVYGSLLSVLLSFMYQKDGVGPQSKQHERDTITSSSSSSSSSFTTKMTFLRLTIKSLRYLTHPTIGPLLFVKFLNGISSSAHTTILPLLLVNKLHFTTHQLGYFMSSSSFTIAVFSAIGMSTSMKYANNRSDKLAYICIGCRMIGMILFGIVVSRVIIGMLPGSTAASSSSSSSTMILQEDVNTTVAAINSNDENTTTNIGLAIATLISIFISLSSHVHATALTTLTTGIVVPNERGTILGLEHGLFSLARIAGPPLGTMLLSSSSSSSSSLRGGSSSSDATPSLFVTVASSDTRGLWRVIATCTIMDIVLMVCLHVWSKRLLHTSNVQRQPKKYIRSDEDEEKSEGDVVHIPLLDMSGSSEKDHSD